MFSLKIAHISDLHFGKFSWDPFQFFSKRWLGNFNHFSSRRRLFFQDRLNTLPELFHSLGVSHVVITGDLSVTSHPKEFNEAAVFVQNLRSLGLETFVIPGNHDHYTRSAFKNRLFYDFFPNDWLKDRLVMKQQIAANWWFVGLDTALATSWVSSRGEFSEEIEERLISLLDEIPDHHFVIMANHFPFFQNESPRKVLSRGDHLKRILSKQPKVKFYLHGHTHRHCIADLRSSQLPIIIDSGSTPKSDSGAWNLISLEPGRCSVDVFRFNETWKPAQKVELIL